MKPFLSVAQPYRKKRSVFGKEESSERKEPSYDGSALGKRHPGYCAEDARLRSSNGKVSGRSHACLQDTWEDEAPHLDTGRRHRSRQPLGLPERRARRDILALHAGSGRGAKAEGSPQSRLDVD